MIIIGARSATRRECERPTKGSGATVAPSPIGVRRSLAETQRLRGKRNRQTEERAAQRDNRERTRVTK